MTVKVGSQNIRNLITKRGYINLSIFMQEVVTEYYNNKESIGTKGDFITAPEISQLFGEMVGIWVVTTWQKMGCPKDIILLEVGAGKGTLLNDLLNATKSVKDFHKSISVHIIENSKYLKNIQINKLKKWQDNINFCWHDDFSNLPKNTLIMIANEFFDAMPINQYVKIKNEWYETIVTNMDKDGDFCFSRIPSDEHVSNFLNFEYPNAQHRAVIEISSVSTKIIKDICAHINIHKGAGIIIDYGYDYEPKSREYFYPTLQAVKDHKYHPILYDIGDADITAHVDFYEIKKAIKDKGSKFIGSSSQRDFLIKTGILVRAENLLKKVLTKDSTMLLEGLDRLISKKYMGDLFKVLVFFGSSTPVNKVGF